MMAGLWPPPRIHRRRGRRRRRRRSPTRTGSTQAQRVVEANAPALQRILNQALDEANWFDTAHQQQVLEAAGKADIEERLKAVRLLLAEETRVAMLIGVAVGFELAHELIDNEET